jgi:1-acyl-sn-glycerol-3-phosphate acyltransferase
MKSSSIALLQYLEAIVLRGIVSFFLRPTISGTDNLKKLIEVKNEHNHSIILISNHINAYDPLYISSSISRTVGMQLYPVWLPAKKRFFDTVLKRTIMNCHGCLPLGIGKDEDSLKSLKVILEKVKSNETICVFPEGQVSTDGKPGPDMGFVTFLARRTTLIIQPIHLSGIMGFSTDWKPIFKRKRRLKISFGEPVIIEKDTVVNSMDLIQNVADIKQQETAHS